MRRLRAGPFTPLIVFAGLFAAGAPANGNSLDRIDDAAVQSREDAAETGDAARPKGQLDTASEVYLGLGFDSNRNGQSPAEPSRFQRLEANHEISFDTDDTATEFSVNLNGLKYNDLEIARNRFDLETRLESTWDLSPNDELRFFSSYVRDWLSFNRADIYESQIYVRHASDQQRAWLKLNSYTQLDKGSEEDPLELAEEAEGGDEDDVFDLDRREPPDYSKLALQAGFIPRPRAPVTVFLIGGLARVAFFNQGEDPDFDRRANDAYAIGGVRFNLAQDFRIEAGWRANVRDFADRVVTSDSTDGLDVRVDWTPLKGVTVSAKVQRAFEETTSVFAIVDDVESHSIKTEWVATDKLTLSVEAGHEIERPVADIVRYEEYELEAIATYAVSSNVEVYAEGLAEFVSEATFDERYERYRIEGGVRMKY
ncbi:MAG: outer membrane beta-barrel protein [Hyphomicrobiaceae bacterium]|nr:outer membrane beta-barrel protein [Hyphomicrobiaceae bacterium]